MQAQGRRAPPVIAAEEIQEPTVKRIPGGYLQASERRLKGRRYLYIPRIQPRCGTPVAVAGGKVRDHPRIRGHLPQHVKFVHGASPPFASAAVNV